MSARAIEGDPPEFAVVDLVAGPAGLQLVARLKGGRAHADRRSGPGTPAPDRGRASWARCITSKPTDADAVVGAFKRDEGDPACLSMRADDVERVEWEHIQHVLHDHGGNVSPRRGRCHASTHAAAQLRRPPAEA
jgi:ActR/RegA family two-component response regulator